MRVSVITGSISRSNTDKTNEQAFDSQAVNTDVGYMNMAGQNPDMRCVPSVFLRVLRGPIPVLCDSVLSIFVS